MARSDRRQTTGLLLCLALMFFSSGLWAIGSAKTLKNNQWQLISFPVGATTLTFGALLGEALPVETYGSNWVLYAFGQGKYDRVLLSQMPKPGSGYWIIQSSGSDVQVEVDTQTAISALTVTSEPCQSPQGCIEINPPVDPTKRAWSMLGTSLPGVSWTKDFRIVADVAGNTCQFGCDLEESVAAGVTSGRLYVFDSMLQQYRSLDKSDYVTGWQGFWILTHASPTTPRIYLSHTPATDSCGSTMQANSEASLNSAIQCYNASDFDVEVLLTSDFSNVVPFESIEPQYETRLTIVGNGFGIASGSAAAFNYVINSGRVLFDNLVLSGTLPAAVSLVRNKATAEFMLTEFRDAMLALSNEGAGAQSTLERSLLVGNETGLALHSGRLVLRDSTVRDSGAAGVVANAGVLSVVNSTISDSYLSGVHVGGGTVSIQSSTIADNRAAAIESSGGSTLIQNSTLSGNRNAISGSGGSLSVGNSSLVYNDADGMRLRGASVTLFSSLVANNGQSGPYGNCIQFSGSIRFVGSRNSSYTSDRTCRQFSVNSALSGTLLPANYDPPLDVGELRENGCSTASRTLTGMGCVQTHALRLSSSANDSGVCHGHGSIVPPIPKTTEDQRGLARDSRCDTGAYENNDAQDAE